MNNTEMNRLDRVANEPWIATQEEIIELAARKGVQLTPRDIKGQRDDLSIDGMEWWAWLDAMTQS